MRTDAGTLQERKQVPDGQRGPALGSLPSDEAPLHVLCPSCPQGPGSQVPSALQVICGKCSEFKAENGRQSRVCRGCFLTQRAVPESPSPEVAPEEPKHSTEVGRPGPVTVLDGSPAPGSLCGLCPQGFWCPLCQESACTCARVCSVCVHVHVVYMFVIHAYGVCVWRACAALPCEPCPASCDSILPCFISVSGLVLPMLSVLWGPDCTRRPRGDPGVGQAGLGPGAACFPGGQAWPPPP